jgi:hypothetical protein
MKVVHPASITNTNTNTDPNITNTDNLTRSISIYAPKDIIKFTSTSYPEPKVIIELCNENEQMFKGSLGYAYAYIYKKNNINKTASLPMSSANLCSPQRG